MNNACKHAVKMHDFSRLKKKWEILKKKKLVSFFMKRHAGHNPTMTHNSR